MRDVRLTLAVRIELTTSDYGSLKEIAIKIAKTVLLD